ncbi:MAG: hypothetical protein GY869_28065, partial [Planctomycetes bacterium]|nr:hypothetical protein [Planctomycetota bacterium]
IIAVDTTNGDWEYTLNAGNTWYTLNNVSSSAAILLSARDENKIRFLPDSLHSGLDSLTFRAWDQTMLGLENLANIDLIGIGGSTPFSDSIEIATISVIPNTFLAPVIDNIPNFTIIEGDSFPPLSLDGFVLDPDTADENLIWWTTDDNILNVQINNANRVAQIQWPNENWNGSETVVFHVLDPTSGHAASDSATFTVTPIDDPPEIQVGGSVQYFENDPPRIISNTLTVSDIDNNNLDSAYVAITSGFVSGEDVLAISGTSIAAVYDASTGVLTLTGESSVGSYGTALRSVTYNNSNQDDPTEPPRTIDFRVFSSDTSTTDSAIVAVTAVNDPPQFTMAGSAIYMEDDPPTLLDSTLTLSDVDGPQINWVT